MVTTTSRGVPLLRLLPILLFLLLALVAAEAAPVHSGSDAAAPADVESVPADRALVLASQFTAGVRGSRAPPVVSA